VVFSRGAITTSPSPAPLTSVRWPDSNAQAAAKWCPLAHVLLFPSLPPRSQLFHRSYSNKHTSENTAENTPDRTTAVERQYDPSAFLNLPRSNIESGARTNSTPILSRRHTDTVRLREMKTGISEASKRVSIFSFATQGGKQVSFYRFSTEELGPSPRGSDPVSCRLTLSLIV